MLKSIYLYNLSDAKTAQSAIETFQEEFDELLTEEFSPDELTHFDDKLEQLANVYAQPIFSELKYEDFEVSPENFLKLKFIFESCRSCVVIENVAELYLNPFQVSYLMELLRLFEDGIVDRGNFQPILSKQDFEKELRQYKNMMNLKTQQFSLRKAPVMDLSPIEKDLDEIRKLIKKDFSQIEMPDKTKHLLRVISENIGDSNHVLNLSGLNPKDFTDHLEKLKLLLKNK